LNDPDLLPGSFNADRDNRLPLNCQPFFLSLSIHQFLSSGPFRAVRWISRDRFTSTATKRYQNALLLAVGMDGIRSLFLGVSACLKPKHF